MTQSETSLVDKAVASKSDDRFPLTLSNNTSGGEAIEAHQKKVRRPKEIQVVTVGYGALVSQPRKVKK